MKEKKIEDFIHLYLGCEVFGTYNDASGSRGYLTGITNGGTECEIQFILEDGINVEEEPVFNTIDEIKLLLRPLSSMTEEECNVLDWYYEMDREKIEHFSTNLNPDEFIWLLSKGFDLFGLIESGLALDKTLVKN